MGKLPFLSFLLTHELNCQDWRRIYDMRLLLNSTTYMLFFTDNIMKWSRTLLTTPPKFIVHDNAFEMDR